MVVVDSSVWIDHFAGRSTRETVWLSTRTPVEEVALTDLALTEILQGFRDDSRFERARIHLATLRVLTAGGHAIAVASARNYRTLRAKGITVRKTIDCLIATFCIEHGHLLLHRDRDFDPFEELFGLRVVHPERDTALRV